ncbi:MAG: hypothetical protein H6998_04295 [Hahellaceae bacterium]|nr:hypothetical protein [Hahellaceae bacterium]
MIAIASLKLSQRTNRWMHITRQIALTTITLFYLGLLGCESGSPPSQSWKYANQGILSADIAHDGQHALVGSIHHGGSLWDTTKGERLYNWNHKQGEYTTLRAASISADGTTAATAERDTIVTWDTTTGKYKAFWKAPDVILGLQLSADGRYALLGLRNNTASYFDVVRGGTIYTFSHAAEIRSVGLSADGKRAITGSDDMTVKVWELAAGKEIFSYEHQNQIKTVAISADGQLAFSTAQREDAIIWDLKTNKQLTSLSYNYENFTSARFSEKGDQLLLGTFQGLIYLVDSKSGQELKRWHSKPKKLLGGAASKSVLSVAFGRKGEYWGLASDGVMGLYK